MHLALQPLNFFSALRLGTKLSLRWGLVVSMCVCARVCVCETERDREREWHTRREWRRSAKIEKLRASGKVIWAKAATLTFMIFFTFKKQRSIEKYFICPLENKVATLAMATKPWLFCTKPYFMMSKEGLYRLNFQIFHYS